jgi:hypothetical protein
LKLKNLVELLVLFFLDFSGSNVRVIGTSGVGARLLFDLVRPIGVIYVFFIDGATYISGQIFEAIIGFDGRRFNNILYKMFIFVVGPVVVVLLAIYIPILIFVMVMYRLFGSVLAPVVISFMLFFTSIVALVCLFVGFLLKLVSHSRIIAITGVFNASYRNIFIAHRPPIRVWLLSIFGVLLYYMSAFSWYYLFNRYYYYNRHHPFGHGWLWSDSPYNGCAIPPSLATQVSPFGGVFSNFSLFEWFNAHSVLLARLQYLVGISGDSVLRTVYYQVEIVYIIAGIILLVSFVFRNSQQSSSFLGRTL